MLPSGYTEIGYVRTGGSYIDTGIVPSNKLKIEAFLGSITIETIAGGLFGARNTNSNTSAGQMLITQATNGIYFGYNNGRTLINLPSYTGRDSLLIQIEGNTCTANFGNYVMRSAERTSATFTGTRNIWLGAMNNAGNPSEVSEGGFNIYYFRMWELSNSEYVLVRDFVPCIRDADNIVGMYDLVTNEFFAPVGTFSAPTYTITATAETGGSVLGKMGKYRYTTLTAVPNEGYVFDAWYSNDTLYSRENPLNVDYSRTLVAKFKKKTDKIFDTGCYLYFKDRYAMQSNIKTACKVETAEIDEDLMQRKVSKFYIQSISDAIMIGDVAILLSPLGKKIYQGIVCEIGDDYISCREMNAYFDTPFLMHTNTNVRMSPAYAYGLTNISDLTAQYGIFCYLFNTASQNVVKPKTEHYETGTGITMFNQLDITCPDLYFGEFTNANFPIIDSNQVVNLEDYLFEMYNTFGIYLLYDVPLGSETGTIKVIYPHYDELKFSNNEENIRNIKVIIDNAETNYIYVYSSDGATFRGEFKASPNVSTQRYKYSIAVKEKLILSDDKLSTIKAQNLTNDFNHRITCDVDTQSNLYGFDDLILGRSVSFYYNNKVYESVISARKYNIDGAGQVKSVSLTLGKARPSLTSKLNLGKVK